MTNVALQLQNRASHMNPPVVRINHIVRARGDTGKETFSITFSDDESLMKDGSNEPSDLGFPFLRGLNIKG
jgi:hypothetical protein